MTARDAAGRDAFANIRTFLQYVQGAPVAGGLPPTIVRDLEEMERRAERVQAMTGLVSPVELSPYVAELLRICGEARAAAARGAVRAASA